MLASQKFNKARIFNYTFRVPIPESEILCCDTYSNKDKTKRLHVKVERTMTNSFSDVLSVTSKNRVYILTMGLRSSRNSGKRSYILLFSTFLIST